jgi:hypothetical protein
MEDTRAVSHRPYASPPVLVGIEETSPPPGQATRAPRPGQVGQPHRDAEAYARHGVSPWCMSFAPLAGWRHVQGTDRRPNVDFAPCLQDLVDLPFPQAHKRVLRSDHGQTQTPAALSEALAPQEARRSIDKVAWHHTPKPGSGLNMAASVLRVLHRQGLERRMPAQELVTRAVAVWEHKRHQDAVKVKWRFTTEDARIKLKKLYPSF